MSKIPFPILNFLDSDVCAVMTLIFLTNLKKCAIFFEKRGYPASVIQAAHHRAQQIDRQSALQTSQKEKNDRIAFTLTFKTLTKYRALSDLLRSLIVSCVPRQMLSIA